MSVFHGLLALALGQPLTPDETARDEALRIIESARTEEHRECWEVTIPYEPSGLPDFYEIGLGGGYIDRQLVSVEIRREPGEAWGEMLTKDGVRRGRIPVDELDRFARVEIYVARARDTELLQTFEYVVDDDGTVRDVHVEQGISIWTTQMPEYEISVTTGSPEEWWSVAWHERGQATTDEVAPSYDMREFTRTWTVKTLLRFAQEHLPLVAPTPELKREILRRFDVPTDSEEAWPRPSLFAYLLYRWRVAEAVEALATHGFEDHALYLRVAVSPDPTALLVEILCGADEGQTLWALDFVVEEAKPAVRRKALLDALHCVGLDVVLRFVLAEVCELESDVEILGAVHAVLDQPELSVRAAVSARRALYTLTGDRSHFDTAFAKVREEHVGEKDAPLEAAKDLVQVRPRWPWELLQALASRLEREGASAEAVSELRDAPPPKARESLSGFDW